MAWDFETDPDFAEQLAWIDNFVRDEVEPLDLILQSPFDVDHPLNRKFVRPLQQQVKDRGLWACHLGPELGGPGYGQVKLALMNEILGRSVFAPTVFGCQAPDSGNAEILAVYGTAEQKARYLQPLLANDIVSCFSMTEPQGGADPTTFSARATLKGDRWVLNGEKWFATNARYASFLLVMAVTDPDAEPHRRLSVFIIPKNAPGLEIVRNVGYGDRDPSHAYLRFTNVGVPLDHMLGGQGDGFVVAQVRLGGGRIHHAMRTIGKARQAFDMLCDRALSRVTRNEPLANKQMVQEKIADSWIELEQFRLLVLRTAWKIDREKDYNKVRGDISAVKAAMPRVLHDIAARAVYIHGSLGLSNETPLAAMVLDSFQVGLADGPTDIHKVTLAKQVLRGRKHSQGLFPDYHLPARREAALAKFGLTGEEAGLRQPPGVTIDRPHGLELVDLDVLATWMDSQGLGAGSIVDVVQLTGGSQNVLLRFRRADREYVLRRPPLNPRHDGSDTMRREARVLKALKGSDIPHAGLIAACDDASILGAAFYLMEPLDGFNAAVGMPRLHAGSPAARHAMGLSVIEGLSRIALIDHEAVGLGDFGKPEAFLERQSRRWIKQLEGYGEFPGWPGAQGLPDVHAIGAWLDRHRPQRFRPGLMHGDFHLKNVLFCQDRPALEAIIDWELSTIGDPLVDLGWLLATWPGPGGDMSQTTIIVQPWDGFPEAEELVEVYGRLTGADLSNLNWYRVFACYKLAVILEGSWARACAGKAPIEIGQRLHSNAVRLLARAGRWIEGLAT